MGILISSSLFQLSFPNMAPLNPTSLSGELPPMSEPFSIIAIGNPGSGKSTTLNYLAQKFVFKSGPSIGSGLTYKLDEEEVRVTCSNGKTVQITFYDTPGLNDAGKRVAAGEAISKALKVRNFQYQCPFWGIFVKKNFHVKSSRYRLVCHQNHH